MKMINKQRVQRIKNLIYAFIVLLMLLPLILMSILSFQMFGAIKDLNTKVDNLSKSAAFQATGTADSGYVLEPDMQSGKPADTENPSDSPDNALKGGENGEDSADLSDNALKGGENPATAPEDVSFDVSVQGEATSPPADGGNELGGGAPIGDGARAGDDTRSVDNTQGEAEGGAYLSASGTDTGSRSTEAEKELAANPQMGYGESAPSPDHTLNPSTGS